VLALGLGSKSDSTLIGAGAGAGEWWAIVDGKESPSGMRNPEILATAGAILANVSEEFVKIA